MQAAKKDITTVEDIRLLVDSFYGLVREDALIGPVFSSVIKDWSPHLQKMYGFWQTILLEEHAYSGRPFPPHAGLPIDAAHFERWVSLFIQAVDKYFIGPKANEASWRAKKMSELFQHKLSLLRGKTGFKPLV